MLGGIYSNYLLRTCISSPCKERRERKQSAVLTFGGFQAHVHGPASRHELCWIHHCQTILRQPHTPNVTITFRMESRCLGVCPGFESPAVLQAGEEAVIFAVCRVAFLRSLGNPSRVLVSLPIQSKEPGLKNWTSSVDARESSPRVKT